MNKTIILTALLAITNTFGQAFDGYGDNKTSIGLTKQAGATGLVFNFDRGLDDNFSYGSSLAFTVNSDTNDIYTDATGYQSEIESGSAIMEKIDFTLRLNYHLGKVAGLSENADLYAGASAGARNLGLIAGYTYMVSDGIGFFAEASVPFYKHGFFTTKDTIDYYNFYNQPVFGIGIVFNK